MGRRTERGGAGCGGGGGAPRRDGGGGGGGRRAAMGKGMKMDDLKYREDLPHYLQDMRADMKTYVNASPRAAVHQVEWRKIMAGDPVEINPSFGHGMKVMTVAEWSAHW